MTDSTGSTNPIDMEGRAHPESIPAAAAPSRKHRQQHSNRWRRVMERFGWRCAYCGVELDGTNGTVDHVVPRSRGGSGLGRANLVAACRSCNAEKADKDVVEWLRTRGNTPPLPRIGPRPKLQRIQEAIARATAATPTQPAPSPPPAVRGFGTCDRKRYAYRSEAEAAARRTHKRVAYCPRCEGLHLHHREPDR